MERLWNWLDSDAAIVTTVALVVVLVTVGVL
jgi:hypothetical protein